MVDAIKKGLPIITLIVISLWSVWPVVVKPDRISDYGVDGILINWITNSAGKNIWEYFGSSKSPMGGIFDGNIFYPYKNVLAYSDMFFVSGLLTYPFVLLSKNPGVVSGISMIVGQASCGIILWKILEQKTGNKWMAVVGALAFLMSQTRWEYQVHLQMWNLQYVMVGTWLVVCWLEDKRLWKLMMGSVILGVSVWESLLPLYFGLTMIAGLVIIKRKWDRRLVWGGIIMGLIAFLPLKAYWNVGREFGVERSIREAAHNSIGIDDVFTKFWSPGLLTLTAVAIFRKRSKYLVGMMVLGLVMAMGPALKWKGETVKILRRYPVPLPYTVFYYLVPGFKALRTPSRWMVVFGIACGMQIAYGLADSKRGVGIVACLLVAILGGTHLLKYKDLPSGLDMPGVYRWLGKQSGSVVLELPQGDENVETPRMYFSLWHQKRLVNGFSGFAPPEKEVKVDYTIVDKGQGVKLGNIGKVVYEDEKYIVFSD